MKCSCCGWNLQGGTKKCPNCGSDISSQAFGGKPGAVLPVLAAAFSVLAVAAVLGVLFFSVLTESRESLSPPKSTSGASSATVAQTTAPPVSTLPQGKEIYNGNGFSIACTGQKTSFSGDCKILLTVTNGSQTDVTLQVRDFKANGFDMHPAFSKSIAAGETVPCEISISDRDLKSFGIESVTEVSCRFAALAADGADGFETESVVFEVGQ